MIFMSKSWRSWDSNPKLSFKFTKELYLEVDMIWLEFRHLMIK